jgi:hypothetical protein
LSCQDFFSGASILNTHFHVAVIPAKAGIQGFEKASADRPIPANNSIYRHANESRHPERFFKIYWIPAFAGMTTRAEAELFRVL